MKVSKFFKFILKVTCNFGTDMLKCNRLGFTEMMINKYVRLTKVGLSICLSLLYCNTVVAQNKTDKPRERVNIDTGWRFMRYTNGGDSLIYDKRPKAENVNDNIVADTRPSQLEFVDTSSHILKPWILPTANSFIQDLSKRHVRPAGNPGYDFQFVKAGFDDSHWAKIDLPHDWAIKESFDMRANAPVGGGMGRLPVPGVAWYRKQVYFSDTEKGRSIFLDIDGAMSYAMIWLNGYLVGGWPYGYNSFRVDLTPYIKWGKQNQLAIRIDNPANSSRWYPGAGIYRHVWLTKVAPVHIAQYGTFITCTHISKELATVNLNVRIENQLSAKEKVNVKTAIFGIKAGTDEVMEKVADFPLTNVILPSNGDLQTQGTIVIAKPKLWGPPPNQVPNRYVAITKIYKDGRELDSYETVFGIRNIAFNPNEGVKVNGESIKIQGVNQHSDLGALGMAFNPRAAQRQLDLLKDAGCNAIRLAHNPPAPELLDMTDKMGFLIIDEIFDCWEKGKTPLDFHLIFKDWHEPDLRSFVRRDRNHPSIMAWSFGNEVGEQYTDAAGAKLAKELHDIVQQEDNTRPATASMNYAKPNMPFPQVLDILALNYQGEGIRDGAAYAQLPGIRTSPLYEAFHNKFPGKMLFSSETASTLSTRGAYTFPVCNGNSAPVAEGLGADAKNAFVSSYDLYTAPFGASPDKVFSAQDQHPYVAGEFVWSGWDYLGEPTPYYSSHSSYSGMIDLAGFKKDRFYLYQSRWRPDLAMAHILPHWTWPDRVGQITPVHIYSTGDEAELFINNVSQGRKQKKAGEYRFRWDSVRYQPGELKVVAYKNHRQWATDVVKTASAAASLTLEADKKTIKADSEDLCFVTLKVLDDRGVLVPFAQNKITFTVSGPADIVATDNGNPADGVGFSAKQRKAFMGLALVIIRPQLAAKGNITVKAEAEGLKSVEIVISTY